MLMLNGYVIGQRTTMEDQEPVGRNHDFVFKKSCKSKGRAYRWRTLNETSIKGHG